MKVTGCGSQYIVGDEDADIAKKLKEDFPDDAPTKCSDPNHFKGTLRRKMVGGKSTVEYVKNSHKLLMIKKDETNTTQYATACKHCGESALGPLAADYICPLFMITMKSHLGDADGMSKGFIVAINHTFDKHDGCDPKWCKALSDDPNEKPHTRLPHGKPLVGAVLHKLLLDMVKKHCPPTICKRLSHGWHSQNCESLHNMIHAKNPKERAQVGGTVFQGRAMRGIAAKNMGAAAAIGVILETQGLSPSKAVTKHFSQRLVDVKRRNVKADRPEQKRRRKSLKFNKKLSNQPLEAGEVYTYTKDTGLDAGS